MIQTLTEENNIDIVIRKYSDMVYRLAAANVNSKSSADDIYQDVFLRYIKAVRKGTNFESEEHRKAWLIRVTLNCCKSLNTSSWFKRISSINENYQFESTDCFNDEKTDIQNALMSLPQKYRSIIHLFYYEQLSAEEISTILKIKPSTVRTQLVRARNMLKETLKGDYFYE